jgi:hypothetical protein
MAIDERRFETVERALDERRQDFAELKESIRHLDVKMDERFSNVEVRFLGIDSRFLAVENRLTALDSKFDVWGARFESRLDGLEAKFGALQKTMDSQFKWLVGIQFGMLVTVIGVLLSR